MLMISANANFGQCDWSKYHIYHSNNRNKYNFTVSDNVWEDTFITWQEWRVYNYQTKKTDTLQAYPNLALDFSSKGKYLVSCVLWSDYGKCETALTYLVEIEYFDSYKFDVTPASCDIQKFELKKIANVDTCYGYYYYIYKSTFTDNMTDIDWDTITWNSLSIFYNFPWDDTIALHTGRIFPCHFPMDGRYIVITQIYNFCNNQDTIVFNKVFINCNGAGVKEINKKEAQVIGTYDMLGRPAVPKEGVPLIYLYNDGSRKKKILLPH